MINVEEIQKQTAEKQNIVNDSRERESKTAQENAVMVEKIKKQIAEKRTEQNKISAPQSLSSFVIVIIAVVFVVFFRRWRRKLAAASKPKS